MRHIEHEVFTIKDLKDRIELEISTGTPETTLVFIEPSYWEVCKPVRGITIEPKMQINDRGDEEKVFILAADRKEPIT